MRIATFTLAALAAALAAVLVADAASAQSGRYSGHDGSRPPAPIEAWGQSDWRPAYGYGPYGPASTYAYGAGGASLGEARGRVYVYSRQAGYVRYEGGPSYDYAPGYGYDGGYRRYDFYDAVRGGHAYDRGGRYGYSPSYRERGYRDEGGYNDDRPRTAPGYGRGDRRHYSGRGYCRCDEGPVYPLDDR